MGEEGLEALDCGTPESTGTVGIALGMAKAMEMERIEARMSFMLLKSRRFDVDE